MAKYSYEFKKMVVKEYLEEKGGYKYFQKYSNEVRNTVKTICTDIYSPYFSLIKDLFPNAKIILDRFHIVNLINRALQKTRVETMKKFPTSSMQYKRLKRYWKLILKDNNKLDGIYFTKRTHFKNWVSEKKLVDETISVDPQLETTYNAYQLLLFDIKNKNYNSIKNHLIELSKENISPHMLIAINTLLKYDNYLTNSLKYKYSNGTLEGINNYIKAVKRIAFGYKSFFNFRLRILITKNLVQPIKYAGQ